ncbi:MAG: hypothetical protein ACKO3V_03310 [Pirellula sp.]
MKSIPGILSLEAISRKATAIYWGDRYKSVDDFRSDLLDWLAGEPVSARHENLWEKAIRWPSRHRTTATGLATGLAGCQEAFKREFRTASILSHKIELHMHLLELLLKSKPLPDAVIHFEQAVESAQELMKLSEPTRDRLQAAIDQLKLGLDLMRAAGFEKEAKEWSDVIKSKGILI